MSNAEASHDHGDHGHSHGDHGHGHHEPSFFFKYIWSTDHKTIGKQFLITGLIWLMIGGALALAVRFHLAWPKEDVPILGTLTNERYNMAFTMHASIMIFFVIIPLLAGAFGNFLIPLMIGARDMAFPWLNALSYWLMWPAMMIMVASFFAPEGAAQAGWTAYPMLSLFTAGSAQTGTTLWFSTTQPNLLYNGQTLWLAGVMLVGFSSVFGSLNYVVTIIKMRAPGMTMFRMPLSVWSLFITAILALFSTPVLTGTLFMQFMDRVAGTSFFNPGNLFDTNMNPLHASGGGKVLLWQHLFWFYSHPAVYLMVLPAMGMVSDIIAVFARKPIFGYRPMVYSIASIAGLGFIVWAHHMFQSGMNPALGMTFMISTMFIALPSAIKCFNWLGTLWGGNITFTTPMLFAISFVSMFIIGGLSGIFMAATPVDMFIHDTYFIVAHIHYVVFCGTVMAIFGSIFYWFPKMYGRMMNETIGKIHWFLTFVFMNGTFFAMHMVGLGGLPRRYASYAKWDNFAHMQPMNVMITVSAICLGFSQFLFLFNFFYSMFWGKKAEQNPWQANTLEWTDAPSPAGHGNWPGQVPTVYRPPYEYSSPEVTEDWLPQSKKLAGAAGE
jgi:cytochrome c oxidase subunit 1